MIKPRYSVPVLQFFHWYIPYVLRSDFQKVEIHGTGAHFPKSILTISNHFSWWDAFILFYLNDKVFKKQFNVMMLEEQLKRFWLFNYGGVYSIKKKSRDIIESLNFTCRLLEDDGNMVQLFPQGMIQSQHLQSLHFEKGLEYVLKNATADYQVIFTVALTDYFSNRKPSLHIFYEAFNREKTTDLVLLEQSYNSFYTNCKAWLINQHKE